MKTDQFIISILVSNHFGVLTRVSGLFTRRGYNIDSLSVGETEDPRYSRMTIVTTGDERIKEQIIKQLEKLYDVKYVHLLDEPRTIARELALIKIAVDRDSRTAIIEAVNVFKGAVVDFTPDSMMVEIVGDTDKLDAFIEYVRPYGILELCRTGVTAMGCGSKSFCNKHSV